MAPPDPLPDDEAAFLSQAIDQALAAEQQGNLPIGAVIVLHGQVISRGANAIWRPNLELTRHAEMEALRAVPQELWPQAHAMRLYTTLEPCLMCAGAILLHHLGGVVFGSTDPQGGIAFCLANLPPYFHAAFSMVDWRGPIAPDECDPLYRRVVEHERRRRAT